MIVPVQQMLSGVDALLRTAPAVVNERFIEHSSVFV